MIIPALDLMTAPWCVSIRAIMANNAITVRPAATLTGLRRAGCRSVASGDLTGAKDPAKRQIPLIKTLVRALTFRCRLAAACVAKKTWRVTGSGRCSRGGWLHRGEITERVKGWFERFGADALVLALESVLTSKATSRWRSAAGKRTRRFTGTTGGNLSARRPETCACTDISRDGTLAGSNVSLYEECAPDIRRWHFSPPAVLATLRCCCPAWHWRARRNSWSCITEGKFTVKEAIACWQNA